jgi:hypothetical protein
MNLQEPDKRDLQTNERKIKNFLSKIETQVKKSKQEAEKMRKKNPSAAEAISFFILFSPLVSPRTHISFI